MLGKLMAGGCLDRKLFYFLDLEDDNELMREFMMKAYRPTPDILQPFPDFGFNNDLHFFDQGEIGNFWKIVSDFIFARRPKFERLKNFVGFRGDERDPLREKLQRLGSSGQPANGSPDPAQASEGSLKK